MTRDHTCKEFFAEFYATLFLSTLIDCSNFQPIRMLENQQILNLCLIFFVGSDPGLRDERVRRHVKTVQRLLENKNTHFYR